MGVFTTYLWADLLIALLSVILLIIAWLSRRYKYWQDRGIPFAKPVFGLGCSKDNLLGKASLADVYNSIYQDFKHEKFVGYFDFHIPKLLLNDPELIHQILIKDFVHFHDRGLIPADIEHEPLTNNISNLEGQPWRQLRYMLAPVFTTGKLKGMFEQIYNCGEDLLEELQKFADSQQPLEARDVMSIFTNDVIASCGFGLQFKLSSPQGKPFKKMVNAAFPKNRFNNFFMIFRAWNKRIARMLKIRFFSQEVTDYFLNLTKQTAEYREKNKVRRKDFFEMLLDLKRKEENNSVGSKQDEEEHDDDALINQITNSSIYNSNMKDAKVMTEECLAASSFTFLVAGSEVSTALGFFFYCLAKYPEAQAKVQQEVDDVLQRHGGFNFFSVKDMEYMDQAIQESFRLYPIAPFLPRVCTIPYKVPGSQLVIEKGIGITLPVWSIHKDPRYYPDPESFRPERFLDNNFKPSPTFLPFGDGPRICIAMRFAILEMKICAARIMSKFSLKLHSKTRDPLGFDPHILATRSHGGVWLTVHNRG